MKLYIATMVRFCVCCNNYLSRSMKCDENVDNKKKLFDFNLANWDAKDLPCQAGNY